MLFISSLTYVSAIDVSWVVQDRDSKASIPGVSVIIKDTTIWTATDSAWNYTLSGVNKWDTLKFSYVWYQPKELTITSKIHNVLLFEQSEDLDDVIITGEKICKKDNKCYKECKNELDLERKIKARKADIEKEENTNTKKIWRIEKKIEKAKTEQQDAEAVLKACQEWTVPDLTTEEGIKKYQLEKDWIYITEECLVTGQCWMDPNEILWLWDKTVKWFFQDIVLTLTMFFGTVLTVIIIIWWVMFIMAWANGDSTRQWTAKKLLIGWVIWFVLVISSYWIVRLIQFLATGWW